jgi:hypothetical protein
VIWVTLIVVLILLGELNTDGSSDF